MPDIGSPCQDESKTRVNALLLRCTRHKVPRVLASMCIAKEKRFTAQNLPPFLFRNASQLSLERNIGLLPHNHGPLELHSSYCLVFCRLFLRLGVNHTFHSSISVIFQYLGKSGIGIGDPPSGIGIGLFYATLQIKHCPEVLCADARRWRSSVSSSRCRVVSSSSHLLSPQRRGICSLHSALSTLLQARR